MALIDVIWFASEGTPSAAFEVEHTTSVYPGIVRLLDLAQGHNYTNETSPSVSGAVFGNVASATVTEFGALGVICAKRLSSTKRN